MATVTKITPRRVEQACTELWRLESQFEAVESALGISGCQEDSMWKRSTRELGYFLEDLLEEIEEAAHE